MRRLENLWVCGLAVDLMFSGATGKNTRVCGAASLFKVSRVHWEYPVGWPLILILTRWFLSCNVGRYSN